MNAASGGGKERDAAGILAAIEAAQRSRFARRFYAGPEGPTPYGARGDKWPARSQACAPGAACCAPAKHRQWLAGLPRMFAGHGMPCPYETSAMARRIAKDVCRARHAVPLRRKGSAVAENTTDANATEKSEAIYEEEIRRGPEAGGDG